jgi:hypothetical protein
MTSIVNQHNQKVMEAKVKADANGDVYNGPKLMEVPEIEFEVDIAAWYQKGTDMSAPGPDVVTKTYKMEGDADWLSGKPTPMKNVIDIPTKKGTGHLLFKTDNNLNFTGEFNFDPNLLPQAKPNNVRLSGIESRAAPCEPNAKPPK